MPPQSPSTKLGTVSLSNRSLVADVLLAADRNVPPDALIGQYPDFSIQEQVDRKRAGDLWAAHFNAVLVLFCVMCAAFCVL